MSTVQRSILEIFTDAATHCRSLLRSSSEHKQSLVVFVVHYLCNPLLPLRPMNLGQLEDSAFHLYYEWVEQQLYLMELQQQQQDSQYESGFFNYHALEDSSDD